MRSFPRPRLLTPRSFVAWSLVKRAGVPRSRVARSLVARSLVALTVGALAMMGALPTAHADPAPSSPGAATPAALAMTVLRPMLADGESLRVPTAADGELGSLAEGLDPILTDAVQDLGLAIEPGRRPSFSADASHPADATLVQRARALGKLLLLPTIRPLPGGDVELRLSLASPSSRAVRVRSERASRKEIPVQALVMLRDLAAELNGAASIAASIAPSGPPLTPPVPSPRSAGRPIVLVTTTLFGGVIGYSIQRASGSDDPRVLYPLLAVGAGIGLGSSIIAAEEWDVGSSDAWYLAAGELWPTLAGHLIYQGRFSPRVESDRWLFSLIGGGSGVALSVLGLTLHPMSDGGAILAHSGGGLGLVLGGFTEALVRGDVHTTPVAGMGYGAGLGWLGCAALATQLRVTPSRMLALDLGALLGGLGGAALGSPLLLRDPSADRQRAWVGLAGGASIAGATIAVLLSREGKPAPRPKKLGFRLDPPSIGVLGESVVGELRAPILGASLRGALP